MSIIDNSYRTVTCNGEGCKNTVTFEQRQDNSGVKEAVDANPWLKTCRVVQQVFGGRNFVYCSDQCELAAVAKGDHNPEEPKKVISTPTNAAVAQAAAAAKAAEEATKALKSGSGVTLQGS